jgi:transposase
LIWENLSGIPVYMQVQSGNINDVVSINLGGYVICNVISQVSNRA